VSTLRGLRTSTSHFPIPATASGEALLYFGYATGAFDIGFKPQGFRRKTEIGVMHELLQK
jgi:hypothetical protein